MVAVFKVGRHRWYPQKKLAVWFCIALVGSLGLSLFSRRTDLHDREGGHFEHDHRRVFDHRTGAMGRSRDTSHGAHSSDLTRRTGPTFSKHATTFGVGERDDGGSGETFSTRFGRDGDPWGSFVGEARDGKADRDGDRFDHRTGAMGRSRDTGHGGHGADSSDLTRRTGPTFSKHATTFGIGERDDDPFVARSPPKKSGWMHELWDETKHLTYEMAGLAEDDWDLESEMARRPKELDDEELDEEIERADDKQQNLFDKEAMTSRYAPRTF
jgi:hypothetical protein